MRPSENREGRLVQMEYLASFFFSGSVSSGGSERILQTGKPLFRYPEQEEAEALDGAIFGMYWGGDPEIILVIEARNTDFGPRWYFAGARMCTWAPVLEFDGKELWSKDRIWLNDSHVNTPNNAYYAVHNVDTVDRAQLRDLAQPESDTNSASGARYTPNAQWEYQELEIHNGHFDKDAADRLGNEGWEMVSCFTPTNRERVTVLIFKRRK
jgi:hypothetical protein